MAAAPHLAGALRPESLSGVLAQGSICRGSREPGKPWKGLRHVVVLGVVESWLPRHWVAVPST